MKRENIWNLMCLLFLGMAPVVQAEQNSLSLSLALNAGDDKAAAVQPTKRDCNNLGYEVTLFIPCGDEDGERLWRQTKIVMVAGFGVAATIALMLEEISGWEKGVYERGDLARQCRQRWPCTGLGILGWCCVSKKVEVTAFNIAYWPAQRQSNVVNGAKDYWGIKFAVQF